MAASASPAPPPAARPSPSRATLSPATTAASAPPDPGTVLPPADFSLILSQPTLPLSPGGAGSLTLTVGLANPPPAPVALRVMGLPYHATASFSTSLTNTATLNPYEAAALT